ncbi:AMP-binding enzyme [Streptomyces monashensis]|uniref:AMP-binding enzyme C-terminal domain-containing protein n=1 Tax=Streptomyces monashensis TaxID=1678012 RepID=A0A1S2PG81_9ACTN|nr:hypothetical protein [Streptomyces monashensis]OIJ92620.1 hypothetical protein BIV23_38385 [Streptomyces monashensis]
MDRKKYLIITGGFNVYPAEVERVISELPGVANAAVIGTPDEHWGEAVTAVVVPKPGETVAATAEAFGPHLAMTHVQEYAGELTDPARVRHTRGVCHHGLSFPSAVGRSRQRAASCRVPGDTGAAAPTADRVQRADPVVHA